MEALERLLPLQLLPQLPAPHIKHLVRPWVMILIESKSSEGTPEAAKVSQISGHRVPWSRRPAKNRCHLKESLLTFLNHFEPSFLAFTGAINSANGSSLFSGFQLEYFGAW